ncbi:virulence RhuM family protein [Rhizobium lemnae]|uniref:Virulence RhuM family protein n=1 Tax=Rhizobium lemnae TaxID=1214924 RepID=A0ABV8E5U4_9HYPH|nr:virulence RhuM family protein [Rhizobium lemnae]MCJ8507767.1 virulence RhuM family protein [Rhizobium lemnae]
MGEPSSEILLYQAETGETRIEVRLLDETVWLTQAQMAELFDRDVRTINEHIGNIYDEGECEEAATLRKFRIVRMEGNREVSREVAHYNLDVIISVGYRAKSHRGVQFRRWATQRLKEYIIKGFVMDDERLKLARHDYFDELVRRVRAIRVSERRFYQKITDIYATSIDYDPKNPMTQQFFATVQNKFHFAIHGMTAPEVIKSRADASKPMMGMTSFKGDSPRPEDATVALNYLTEDELLSMERIVDQYLSFAEEQAARRKPMAMADWITKLHGFLELNDRDVLTNSGKVSRKDADAKALAEFEKYRIEQDRIYVSDFDRSTRELLKSKREEKP